MSILSVLVGPACVVSGRTQAGGGLVQDCTLCSTGPVSLGGGVDCVLVTFGADGLQKLG